MPRLKSAIKRVRTSERNRVNNLVYRTQIKTLTKKVIDFIESKDAQSASKAASEAFALIDRAATKKVIHLNNADRKKSRISKWLKKIDSDKSQSKPKK